ncbi:predicted protein [Chaetoceros tenuissimus]|uniref:Uncharacterized protein n=1 Tax=Chaetoceros tenuissimus TaxID=426638 RepID=A0AAD3HB66_9STRA|nr:predicted protein [Chaetoceros tenuissimus]
MHWLIEKRTLDDFKALFQITLEMHPAKVGYLFQKDADGQQTAVESAIQKYGGQETMAAIHDIISQFIDNFEKEGKTFMHWLIEKRTLDDFKALFQITLELYPEKAGYLFQKHNDSQETAVERAIQKYGGQETMAAINEIISPAKQFPILHHALVHAPKLQNHFMEWFPWASRVRDHNDRSLIQAIVAAGAKSVRENSSSFALMTNEQIYEKDPVTSLYPFAAVARGEDGDLDKTFYLLNCEPSVVDEIVDHLQNREPRSAFDESVVAVGTKEVGKKRKRGESKPDQSRSRGGVSKRETRSKGLILRNRNVQRE